MYVCITINNNNNITIIISRASLTRSTLMEVPSGALSLLMSFNVFLTSYIEVD